MEKKIFEKVIIEIVISSNDMLTADGDWRLSGQEGFDQTGVLED